jgi:glucose-6-phosphate 1-dehydrogenase
VEDVKMNRPNDQLLVIFGASGDLTGRKLLPALFELHVSNMLPEHFAILGAARTAFTDEEFRAEQRKHILEARGNKETNSEDLDKFLQILFYLAFDSTNTAEYVKLKDRIHLLQQEEHLPDKVIYYLATPPLMYELVPKYLQENGMNVAASEDGWRRVIVEKPFGTSLDTAQQLNQHLCRIFDEKEIYRIDHYLGKETVQNILVLRFSNGIFEPLWNRNYVDSIEISASETLGVENRGKYYDGAGAMRDMIQNHLMQLMAFAAMESPSVFDPESIRDEIVKVFRSIRPYTIREINEWVVRGQYEGYREEKNVAPDSNTETYVGMKFFIDNWRWSGVPFYFFTGKKLPEKSSEIVIHFKSTPHQLFAGQCSGSSCNKLVIRIQPDESITLRFGLKMPGAGFTVKQVGMEFRYDSLSKTHLPDAYERLLLDAMLGDSTLYARSDALEASWRFIDPILHHWKEEGSKRLFFYEPGQNGPIERMMLGADSMGAPCDSCG